MSFSPRTCKIARWENGKIGKQDGREMEILRARECVGLMLNTEESSSHHKYI